MDMNFPEKLSQILLPTVSQVASPVSWRLTMQMLHSASRNTLPLLTVDLRPIPLYTIESHKNQQAVAANRQVSIPFSDLTPRAHKAKPLDTGRLRYELASQINAPHLSTAFVHLVCGHASQFAGPGKAGHKLMSCIYEVSIHLHASAGQFVILNAICKGTEASRWPTKLA
ncbi:hypothetical protein SODALDRAFT_379437 [Sodiomyces alkalinus F11]|uniref:Uncharacterized protein n=1 Tax=Sodiomyces alkalinus (strain CBS 110278 / VKM F-3762 / F11) TaxID=1314773 RepID=A0A3N2PUS0_SODAK|nr:hypothetical protein SODALDRAFT_379437 [Sodiomyces alkalinus F11]ROT38242.1 hypothetical protein SODALDRAFT_379437 [Sodiomyces alkalinus F11]